MRLATALIAMGLASSGTAVHAQAIGLSGAPVPVRQPSFHIQSFRSARMPGPLSHPIQFARFGSAATSKPVTYPATPLNTCPMPVAHTDTVNLDSMPVARGGHPVPMPVAKSGCTNPLDRRP